MAQDVIKAYILTPDTGIRQYCHDCRLWQCVWSAETEASDIIVWCGKCGMLLKRTSPKPEVAH